jgi:hypothetical protein
MAMRNKIAFLQDFLGSREKIGCVCLQEILTQQNFLDFGIIFGLIFGRINVLSGVSAYEDHNN